MPFFNYNCKACETEYEDIAKPKEEVECPACGVRNPPRLASGAEQVTLETKDSWRGVRVPKDNEKKLRARMKNYQKKYEMAEMIEKHGLNTAKKNQWTKKIKKI